MNANVVKDIVIGVDGCSGRGTPSGGVLTWLPGGTHRHRDPRLRPLDARPARRGGPRRRHSGTSTPRNCSTRPSGSAQLADPGLTITTDLVDDGAASAIIEASRHADTIVIGARGVHGFSTLVAGSTTMNIATHALCTVVAVPTGRTARFHGPRHRGGRRRQRAVRDRAIGYAFQHAAETHDELTAAPRPYGSPDTQ